MSPHKRKDKQERVIIVEKNIYRKNISRKCIRIALAYPSTYQVAMSSLSVHLLYSLLNQYDDVYAERVVMEGSGPYRSIETGTMLRDFDIVMFSVHYELDYVNIVRMLEESGIPARSRERREGKFPVVIVGGPTVSANPEPLADIADIVVIGEAEPTIERLINSIPLILDKKFDAVASERGIYVPSLGKHTVHYEYARELDATYYPTKQIVVLEAPDRYMPIFGKAFFLEVARGCPFMCKFCMEAYVQFPFRIRSYSKLIEVLEEGLKHCPVRKIVLVGLASQSHPDIKKLSNYILGRGLTLSFPSIRADKVDEELLTIIARSGQDVLTVAPESSERLRYAVGKNFSNNELIEICAKGLSVGLQHVKLYLIAGLPGETECDIRECIDLVRRVRKSTKGKIYLSVNPWIRKPQTPLQYFPPENPEQVSAKIRALVDETSVRHTVYDPALAYGQMLLALGDRDVCKVIIKLARDRVNPLARSTWKKTLRDFPDLYRKYVFRHYLSTDTMPWSHVKLGLSERTIVKKAKEYAELVGLEWN